MPLRTSRWATRVVSSRKSAAKAGMPSTGAGGQFGRVDGDHGAALVERAPQRFLCSQHISAARHLGMDVASQPPDHVHMADPAAFARQARLMESYGADCVYVTDSKDRPRHGRRSRPRPAPTAISSTRAGAGWLAARKT
jgi:hypothetical protein